jgi:hypothetical protein
MKVTFQIDPLSGSIHVGDVVLKPFEEKLKVDSKIGDYIAGSRDHQNGYQWLDLARLSFAGEAAALSICFFSGRLAEASWSVLLPNAPTEGGWPTMVAIDNEIAFVRRALRDRFGSDIDNGQCFTLWGTVWSCFDAKGFLASNGLCYSKP